MSKFTFKKISFEKQTVLTTDVPVKKSVDPMMTEIINIGKTDQVEDVLRNDEGEKVTDEEGKEGQHTVPEQREVTQDKEMGTAQVEDEDEVRTEAKGMGTVQVEDEDEDRNEEEEREVPNEETSFMMESIATHKEGIKDSGVTITMSSSDEDDEDESETTRKIIAAVNVKRKPGRPKGSKNKTTKTSTSMPVQGGTKRKRGRPAKKEKDISVEPSPSKKMKVGTQFKVFQRVQVEYPKGIYQAEVRIVMEEQIVVLWDTGQWGEVDDLSTVSLCKFRNSLEDIEKRFKDSQK